MSDLLSGLNPQQREIARDTEGNILCLAGAGAGKSLSNNSIVKTPNGNISIGDIIVGTEVFNSYGSLSKVTGVYPQGPKEVWEVEFSDGIVIESCKDHLWNYQTASQRTNNKSYNTDTLETISSLPLQTKAGGYDRWNIYIPMTQPVYYPEREFFISPYLLGALIGDGYLASSFMFSNSEEDVLSKVKTQFETIGYTLTYRDKYDWSVTMKKQSKISPLRLEIERLGLMGCRSSQKFIPDEYIKSSVDQRLDLLKGLVDTDGECSNGYYYSTTSEKLAAQIIDLVQSLGMTASLEKRQTFYTYLGEKKPGLPSYRLAIKPSDEIQKIHSSNKHEAKWKKPQSVARRTIRRITSTGRMTDMTCIKVDAKNELFLTDGYIVTHNTRVLIYRIAHLIKDCGIRPWNILSVTFTNKAAREMESRLVDLVGEDGRDVWMGTFHGTCVRILRRFGEHIGLDGGRFTIIDEKDQKKLLKEVIAACGFEYEPDVAARVIGDAKNELLNPSDLEERATRQHEKDMANVYLAYEDKKRELAYVDYDDLIMKTVHLLSISKEARDHYQNQFKYICSDETQDTNIAQFKLLQLLSAHHGNLFAVGDDSQSIYKWRGAKIDNIINFARFFPHPKTYKLEQNYRSTKTIVNAANAVIENNKERLDKTAFTENPVGDAIVLHRADDDTREADFVCDVIQRTKQVEGRSYSDFAVLYRTNRQSREIEKALTQRGISYQILNGSAFYDRKEIKDTIGYLRAIDNTLDAIAFERIVNVPKRGIGKTTIDRIQDYALDCSVPFTKALENVNDIQKISPKTRQKILDFLALLDNLRSFQGHEDFSMVSLIQKVLNDTGYKESLVESGKTEDESRIENLDELLNVAAGWDKDNTTGKSLNDFLTETTLVSDVDGLDATEMVTLLTIHSSKG